jgi:arabinose-5-phosphate isomerase
MEIEEKWLRETLSLNSGSFDAAVEVLRRARGKIVVCGMGKSGIVARKIAATLTSTGSPAYFLHPAEGIHGDIGILARGDAAWCFPKAARPLRLPQCCRLWAGWRFPWSPSRPAGTRFWPGLPEFCYCCLTGRSLPLQPGPTASTTAMMALGTPWQWLCCG